MVVNDHHKFVFVHVPKTAGTSITRALNELYGTNPAAKGPTKHETPMDFFRCCKDRTGQLAEHFRAYRFFAFVRNPWDRLASLHRYLIRRLQRHPLPVPCSFDDFVSMLDAREPWLMALHSSRPQSDYVDDSFAFVGRYERLKADFDAVCAMLRIGTLELPHRKRTTTGPVDYRLCYSDRAAETLGRFYAGDIARFGYSFDRPPEA